MQNFIAATCDPPISLQNGVIIPYSNTLGGAMVTFVCWTIHETMHQSMCKETNISAICNANGNWERNLETICAEPLDSGTINGIETSCIFLY